MSDATEHPVMAHQIVSLEQQMTRLWQREAEKATEWTTFLIQFGELKAKVEGLSGRLAGYVVAGSVLTGGLALLVQFLLHGR